MRYQGGNSHIQSRDKAHCSPGKDELIGQKMNIEAQFKPLGDTDNRLNTHLLNIGLDGLRPFQDKTDDLLKVLEKLEEIGDRRTAKSAAKLALQIQQIEASVTMIGQVKAGKTSLVNAMTGWPDLLPADVNPWTSVVTSLHLCPEAFPTGDHSSFDFFEEEEWNRLMDRGGRMGELASRTGAEDELEKIRAQIEEMRAKSRRRLGKKFELLLGQSHDYGYFDTELIEAMSAWAMILKTTSICRPIRADLPTSPNPRVCSCTARKSQCRCVSATRRA